MFSSTRIRIMMFLVVLTGGWTLPPASAQDGAPPAAPPPITTIPSDGFNMKVAEQPTPDQVVAVLEPPAFNWFAGRFTNLPTDKEVTIGFCLESESAAAQRADVTKWNGLRSLMTYGNPDEYEAYEWFWKDADGNWISGDPLKSAAEKHAGTGRTPQQRVIPPEIAEQFLSADGKYWSPWREIDQSQTVEALQLFRMKHHFSYSTAAVAMRIPFTYTMFQTIIARLRGKQLPGVWIDEVGLTPENRKLQIIRIEGEKAIGRRNVTVLVTAREHAVEHASSWALYGMISSLLDHSVSDPCRKGINWLFIPIQDPEGSAHALHSNRTNLFENYQNPHSEAISYAKYFIDYVNAGNSLDLCLTLHNVEANECPNIFCPLIPYEEYFARRVIDINKTVFSQLARQQFRTGAPEQCWGRVQLIFRLNTWCALRFTGLDLAYEVNDRYPAKRLNQQDMDALGRGLIDALTSWITGAEGIQWHNRVCKSLEVRRLERELYYLEHNRNPEGRTNYDLLIQGF